MAHKVKQELCSIYERDYKTGRTSFSPCKRFSTESPDSTFMTERTSAREARRDQNERDTELRISPTEESVWLMVKSEALKLSTSCVS